MKAALYLRVSTNEQTTDNQRRQPEQACLLGRRQVGFGQTQGPEDPVSSARASRQRPQRTGMDHRRRVRTPLLVLG